MVKPVMLSIVGDSAAGKTTFSKGLEQLLGSERVAVIGTDDYHRYDRQQRKELDISALHPDCNYLDIMAQHLRLLSGGEPVLKPVYDHSTGTFGAPEYVPPRPFMVVEGLLATYTRSMRETFDVNVYLDPPEDLRQQWKIERDTAKRGSTPEQVVADLERREADSAAFIRPQRQNAAHVIRFERPDHERDSAHLSMRMTMRPTITHRDLREAAEEAEANGCHNIRLELGRDDDSRSPVDLLHVHADISPEETSYVEGLLWKRMNFEHHLERTDIGNFLEGNRERHSDSLAIAQLFLTYHLLNAAADPDGVNR